MPASVLNCSAALPLEGFGSSCTLPFWSPPKVRQLKETDLLVVVAVPQVLDGTTRTVPAVVPQFITIALVP
jgi:hypothetical protein